MIARQTRKNQRGYSLVELMVVVLVLTLLAGIIIANLMHAHNQSLTQADEQDLKVVADASEAFYQENNGTYPAAMDDLVPHYLTILPSVPSGGQYTILACGGAVKCDAGGSFVIRDGKTLDPTTTTNFRDLQKGTGCSKCLGLEYEMPGGIFGW